MKYNTGLEDMIGVFEVFTLVGSAGIAIHALLIKASFKTGFWLGF